MSARKPKPFFVGDVVTWTSSAAGSTTRKTGRIVEVVDPGASPTVKGRDGFRIWSSVAYRQDRSYVVQVGAAFYWPRVSHLKPSKRKIPAPFKIDPAWSVAA